jgi:ApaG protein
MQKQDIHTATTEGVKVTVFTKYRPDLSEVDSSRYFFNYQIEILNSNNFPVKLLYRNWFIFDSLEEAHVIKGDGVIGEQPELKSGESFIYTSGCELHSEIGYMRGFYTFDNLLSGQRFDVSVPQFQLIYTPRLN